MEIILAASQERYEFTLRSGESKIPPESRSSGGTTILAWSSTSGPLERFLLGQHDLGAESRLHLHLRRRLVGATRGKVAATGAGAGAGGGGGETENRRCHLR